MRHGIRVLVPILMGALTLSACFRIESAFEINEDGTADIVFETAFDVAALTQFAEIFGQDIDGAGGMSVEELFDELGAPTDPCSGLAEVFGDYEIVDEDLSSDGEVAARCTVVGVPLDELTEAGEGSAPAITQADGVTTFDVPLDGIGQIFGGIDAGAEDFTVPGFQPDELLEISFRASAPGRLTDHNATFTEGSTAIWSITPDADFASGDDAVMSARWEPGSGSSSTAIIVLVIASVVIAAAVGVTFALRSRGRGDEGGDEGDPEAPSPPQGAPVTTASPPPPPPPSPPPPAPSPPSPRRPPADGPTGGDLPPPPRRH